MHDQKAGTLSHATPTSPWSSAHPLRLGRTLLALALSSNKRRRTKLGFRPSKVRLRARRLQGRAEVTIALALADGVSTPSCRRTFRQQRRRVTATVFDGGRDTTQGMGNPLTAAANRGCRRTPPTVAPAVGESPCTTGRGLRLACTDATLRRGSTTHSDHAPDRAIARGQPRSHGPRIRTSPRCHRL
jgi:hypothetical protein